MSRFFAPGLALVASLAVASCASAPVSNPSVVQSSVVEASATRPDLVILVSIDGFRPDYLGKGQTAVLDGLAAGGAFGPMRPSFPSVTFPNHYTLVTGLHPDHHGVVGNRFTDAQLGVFSMASKETGFWDQGEPILGLDGEPALGQPGCIQARPDGGVVGTEIDDCDAHSPLTPRVRAKQKGGRIAPTALPAFGHATKF